ncbi:MAG: hypothetical protein IJU54_00270 [Alphaproteobacteria bacterium]|nr:hypothetical protein [Alphaproteobacteria bacterium]
MKSYSKVLLSILVVCEYNVSICYSCNTEQQSNAPVTPSAVIQNKKQIYEKKINVPISTSVQQNTLDKRRINQFEPKNQTKTKSQQSTQKAYNQSAMIKNQANIYANRQAASVSNTNLPGKLNPDRLNMFSSQTIPNSNLVKQYKPVIQQKVANNSGKVNTNIPVYNNSNPAQVTNTMQPLNSILAKTNIVKNQSIPSSQTSTRPTTPQRNSVPVNNPTVIQNNTRSKILELNKIAQQLETYIIQIKQHMIKAFGSIYEVTFGTYNQQLLTNIEYSGYRLFASGSVRSNELHEHINKCKNIGDSIIQYLKEYQTNCNTKASTIINNNQVTNYNLLMQFITQIINGLSLTMQKI